MNNYEFVAEILWSLTNVASDSEENIDALMNHSVLTRVTDNLTLTIQSINVEGEVITVISNIIVCGSVE